MTYAQILQLIYLTHRTFHQKCICKFSGALSRTLLQLQYFDIFMATIENNAHIPFESVFQLWYITNLYLLESGRHISQKIEFFNAFRQSFDDTFAAYSPKFITAAMSFICLLK
jgi:hypothetical protein